MIAAARMVLFVGLLSFFFGFWRLSLKGAFRSENWHGSRSLRPPAQHPTAQTLAALI
jgi:hypothetical protein